MPTWSYSGPRGLYATDPLLDKQWHLKRLDVFAAWRMLGARGMPDVTLASEDTCPLSSDWPPSSVASAQVSAEPFTVGSDGTVQLKFPPDQRYAISVTINGSPRTVVASNPGVGQVAFGTWLWTPYYTYEVWGTEYTRTMTCGDPADVGQSGVVTYYDRRWRNNWDDTDDLISADQIYYGTDYHGAGVMGVLAATPNNSVAGSGIAPGCRITYAVNGMDTGAGLAWANAHAPTGKAFIVSCSNGNGMKDTILYPNQTPNQIGGNTVYQLQQAQAIHAAGGLLVQAAGNSNTAPTVNDVAVGNMPYCVCVGAIAGDDSRWVRDPADYINSSGSTGSAYGTLVDVIAPGLNIPGPSSANGAIGFFNHTSAATPAVAGVCALILSANPDLTNEQVRSILYVTCDASFYSGFAADFPNASGVPNAGRGVAKALATLSAAAHDARFPASAGRRVFPHFAAWKRSGFVRAPEFLKTTDPATCDMGVGPWSLQSSVGTTLDGPVVLDLAAFAADGSTPVVRLKVGGTTIYQGPPIRIAATASAAGTNVPLTVEADDASGNTTSETYTDVAVTSLRLATTIAVLSRPGSGSLIVGGIR